MNNGRYCGNCAHYLADDEFDSYGSWSYTCTTCGFRYNHSHSTTDEQAQIDRFRNEEQT